MSHSKAQQLVLIFAVFIFMTVMALGSANAMTFAPGKNTTIDCDVTLTYGAGWRVSDQDDDKLADPNTDDGNRNFDQWDMINNKATIYADIDIQFKNFGIFARPKAFYDHVYATDNADNTTGTNNAAVFLPPNALFPGHPGIAPLVTGSDEWHDDVESKHGYNAYILDLFGYATFDLGSRLMDIRVGKQVISWGESAKLSGGIASAQSHVDIAAATAVGTELKEIFLPSESAFVQVDLTSNMALAAYYQWKWEESEWMEAGTFFSPADIFDDVGNPIIAPLAPGFFFPAINRVNDVAADDSGQFGVALTYVWEWLNATEFGVYYINYHDKNPTVNLTGFVDTDLDGIPDTPTQYFLSYTEDIKLYGASFSSQIGDANVSGEFSYRQDFGFGPGMKANLWQAQTSWVYVIPFDPIADQVAHFGEIACMREIGTADDTFAWAYVLTLGFDWYQVARSLDVGMDLAYQDAPSGTSGANAAVFTEGSASGSIGFDLTYKTVYKAAIKYENKFNSVRNGSSDRDTIALTLSYTF